jgi:hypothetical protein
MDCRGFSGLRDCGHPNLRPGDRGPSGGHGGNAPQGRSLRLDWQRRRYMPDVLCAACKWRGHPTSSCDMLAIALFVDCHKQQLSENKKLAIEETWLARWKDKVGQPTRTPRQVMKAYCEDLDISADHLVEAMEWECWPVSKDNGVNNK